jgi:hypothetical protein
MSASAGALLGDAGAGEGRHAPVDLGSEAREALRSVEEAVGALEDDVDDLLECEAERLMSAVGGADGFEEVGPCCAGRVSSRGGRVLVISRNLMPRNVGAGPG